MAIVVLFYRLGRPLDRRRDAHGTTPLAQTLVAPKGGGAWFTEGTGSWSHLRVWSLVRLAQVASDDSGRAPKGQGRQFQQDGVEVVAERSGLIAPCSHSFQPVLASSVHRSRLSVPRKPATALGVSLFDQGVYSYGVGVPPMVVGMVPRHVGAPPTVVGVKATVAGAKATVVGVLSPCVGGRAMCVAV